MVSIYGTCVVHIKANVHFITKNAKQTGIVGFLRPPMFFHALFLKVLNTLPFFLCESKPVNLY